MSPEARQFFVLHLAGHETNFDFDMQIFADKLVEIMSMEDDYVWIHDYHLLVLPSLLRKKFNKMRCGLFLHSPFPSSEIFRTFPKRDELIRSMLNADLIGKLLDTP